MKSFIIFAGLIAACCLQVIISQAQSSQLNNDYLYVSSAPVKSTFYRTPQHMAIIGKDRDVNGAWGPVNGRYDSLKAGNWFIEEQRNAAEAITAGIVSNDTATINRGLQGYDWGFQQQLADGSYNCGDTFHSTSFFVEAVAHSCLLLQQSPYAGAFATHINTLKRQVLKSAYWMIRPDIFQPGIKKNMPYTHRRYLVACALGETGVLWHDSTLVSVSRKLIDDGLSLQDSTGFNPEKGGYDCSYHGVGLGFAHRYYDWVANAAYRQKIIAMYGKGISWLLTRINPDYTLNPQGNTRTGLGQEKNRAGIFKTIDYGDAVKDIFWWARYTHDDSLNTLAVNVWKARKNKIN